MELSPQDKEAHQETKAKKSKVAEWLGEFLDVNKINPKILKRLELLNSLTNFVEEEKESIQYAKTIFNYYNESKPDAIFSKEEKDTVLIGLILAEIGKTGPVTANEFQQALIVRLFNISGVRDIKHPIRHFIETRFPETAERDIELSRERGLAPSMPIEQFWRLHSGWTLQIIEGDGVPEEDIPGAALHHILEGDNSNLLDEDGNFKTLVINGVAQVPFGENRRFDRPEKLVVLLDKYVAFMKRIEGMTHGETIEKLRRILDRNERYKADPEFLELVEDLSRALK